MHDGGRAAGRWTGSGKPPAVMLAARSKPGSGRFPGRKGRAKKESTQFSMPPFISLGDTGHRVRTSILPARAAAAFGSVRTSADPVSR